MRLCTNCGAQLEADSVFCPNCGMPQQPGGPVPPETSGNGGAADAAERGGTKKKTKALPIILIAVAAVLLIVGTALFFILRKGPAQEPPTETQTQTQTQTQAPSEETEAPSVSDDNPAPGPQLIADSADLISDGEEAILRADFESVRKKYAVNVAVCTISDASEQSVEAAAQHYVYNVSGLGRDTVLLYVNIGTRRVDIFATAGLGEEIFNAAKREYLLSRVQPLLTSGDYYEAFRTFGNLCEGVISGNSENETGPTPAASPLPTDPAGILAKYKEVMDNTRKTVKTYDKLDWTTVPELDAGTITGAVRSIMDSAVTGEDAAELQENRDDAGAQIPPVNTAGVGCALTDAGAVKSAGCVDNGDGTATITIVLNDELNPEPMNEETGVSPSKVGGIFDCMSQSDAVDTVNGYADKIPGASLDYLDITYKDCTVVMTFDIAANHATEINYTTSGHVSGAVKVFIANVNILAILENHVRINDMQY